MPGHIYLVTSTGSRLGTSTGSQLYIHDCYARTAAFLFRVSGRCARAAVWLLPIRLFTAPLYRVSIAAWSAPGTILATLEFAEGGALTLPVSLANGDYVLTVEREGCLWRRARQRQSWVVRISGGLIVVGLPPPLAGLGYRWTATQTLASWTWPGDDGYAAPADFALWTSPTSPVPTGGAPAAVVTAYRPGAYESAVTQAAAVLYVALCARSATGTKGPLSTLTIPAPPAALAQPRQTAMP